MSTERPSLQAYLMSIAKIASTRATCDRRKVGCVIARDGIVLSTGYNGSMAGHPHCFDVGHLLVNNSCVRTLHAEENAICQAAVNGISLQGSTAFITHFPCWKCFRMLGQAGICCIVYEEPKLNDWSPVLIPELKQSIIHINGEKLTDQTKIIQEVVGEWYATEQNRGNISTK